MVRIRILIVHQLAELHPPLGHGEGEADIDRDGRHDGGQIPDIEEHEEDHADQTQLDEKRDDVEQKEAQQEFHALHPALHDPAEAPGLARDVIAQGQRMDVLKRLKRHRPQRALRHFGEHGVAQLLEAHGQEPGDTIGHRQAHRTKRQHPGRAVARLAGQTIDGGLVEQRRRDRDQLGPDEERHGDDDAPLRVAVAFGPEVGNNALNRA